MLVRITKDKFNSDRFTQLELLTPDVMIDNELFFQSKTKEYKIFYNPETGLYTLFITDKAMRRVIEKTSNSYFFTLINRINVPDESY